MLQELRHAVSVLVLLVVGAGGAGAQPPCPTDAPVSPVIQWEGELTRCTRDNGVPCAAGEPIRFWAVPASGGQYAECETFQWNFGDGGFSEEREPVHIYAQPGDYFVTVLVVNPEGINGNGSQVPATQATVNPSISEFTVLPATVRRGGTVTITWKTQYTSRVTIAPLGFTSRDQSGSHTFIPSATTVYSLTAEGRASAVSATLTVTVVAPRRRAIRH